MIEGAEMESFYNTPDIEFKVNPIYSCYCLWSGTLNGSGDKSFDEKRKKFAASFNSPEISGLVDATLPWKNRKTLSNIQKVQGIIGEQNVQNIADLQKILNENFDKENAEQLTEAIRKALPEFKKFLTENKNVIDNDLKVLDETQKVYGRELSTLYKCLGVDENKKGVVFINPSPVRPLGDGISTSLNASMNYSLSKDEDSANYLANSNILSRKSSTPFHETTHFLFNNSKVKAELSNPTTEGAKKLMKWLTEEFDKKPEEKRVGNDSGKNAIGAMNELFAVCSTALYNEKTTGKPIKDGDKWYHGFEMPNRLAPVVYPMYKDYINSGRSFDGAFYEDIYKKMKNLEHLNSMRKRVQDKSKKIPENGALSDKNKRTNDTAFEAAKTMKMTERKRCLE